MAFSESQPTVSLVAETTFAKTDLYKFVELSSDNRVQVPGSTAIPRLVGTLLSETYSTSTGANETVTVGRLQGVGKVFMAGSTLAAGDLITCSTLGYGIASSTNRVQLGIIVDGSSGTTGRIHSVLFTRTPEL